MATSRFLSADELRAEAVALTADPEDCAEARKVLDQMDDLRSRGWPTDGLPDGAART
jgi:hypothetical protein